MKISEATVSGEPIKLMEEGENHVARIEGHLSRVFRRNGYEGVETHTPLIALLKKDEGSEDEDNDPTVAEDRIAMLRRLMEFFFADGPHPGYSMRRVYAVARAYHPALIANMNGTDLAVLFDETRAAVSHRCKLMFTDYVQAKTGLKNNKVHFQRTESARQSYAASALGNQNRKGKKVAALVRDKQ